MCLFSISLIDLFLIFSTSELMYSGVVPQQPPTTLTPLSTALLTQEAKSSADTSYTALPLKLCGIPAFGINITGKEVALNNSSITGSNSFGPNEQLAPIASTPKPSNIHAIADADEPVISFPFSLYAFVTNIGRLLFSFAAITHAFVS